jgi:predicted nucleotidyltransferase
MKRNDLISKLQNYKKANSDIYHLARIGIFGSYARNEADGESDIDIVVELEKPDLFVLGNIKNDLEEIFGISVDVIRLREKMNQLLKKRIEKEAIYV